MTATQITPEALAAALAIVQKAVGCDPTQMGPTVRELWAKYEAAEASQVKSWDRSALCGREILAAFGDRPAPSITLADIDEWRAKERKRLTRRGTPTTPASRNRTLTVFRRMLNWAFGRELLDRHPLARLKLEPEDNLRETVLTDADVETLMAAADPRLRTIILVLFDTGCRRSEILNLRWDQIDAAGGCLNLSSKDTKNKRPRRPHLTRRALKALLDHPRHAVSPYVFVRPDGDRYHERYIYELYEAAVADSGLQGVRGESITMHSLRHAFIAKARKLHMPERTVMAQTGHLTRAAFDRYGGQTDDGELAALVENMERSGPSKKGQG